MTRSTPEVFAIVGLGAALIIAGLSLVIGILPSILIVSGGTLMWAVS